MHVSRQCATVPLMKKKTNFVASLTNATEQTLCVVNGVIGDKLEESRIGLATKMALYAEDKPVTLTKRSLKQKKLNPSGKICILAHGSCGSEKGWGFPENAEENYGSQLQKDFGLIPFFLRYNSGLHISTNGKRLSDLLEKLVRGYPQKVNELVLVGHSMGGLVFRSACHYGQKKNKKWVRLVSKIFYIASPHAGTHLEKIGKLTTVILNQIPNPITKIIGYVGDLRSNGIKDLRHGYLTDEAWQERDAERLFYWPQNQTPLLKKTDHYFICGTLSKAADSKMGRLFGDGLVHPASGTGQTWFSSHGTPVSPDHCKIIPGISHHRLQKSRRVYAQIRYWIHQPSHLKQRPYWINKTLSK